MDPTVNIQEQLRIAGLIRECESGGTEECGCVDHAARLADLVLALNEWIARGGALPAQWTGKGVR